MRAPPRSPCAPERRRRRRHLRRLLLRRLVAPRLRLTRDLRLRGRAIVPVIHERTRLSPRAGKEDARIVSDTGIFEACHEQMYDQGEDI